MSAHNRDLIPIFVLAGALGSGKTTLMARLAQHGIDTGRRVGMVVNDYADLGVDALVLAETGWPHAAVDSLNGACVCCTEGSDLEEVLRGMLELDRDLLLFETTGVADATDMLAQLTSRELRLLVQSPRLVTVLDLTRYPESAAGDERVRRQVSLADALILTKADLAGGGQVPAALDAIRSQNTFAPAFPAPLSQDDLAALLALASRGERSLDDLLDGGLLEHEHPHTLSLLLPHALRRERFEAFLRALPTTVLRAKGFVALDVEPALHLFQYVEPGTVSITPFRIAPRPGLTLASGPDAPFAVFIGAALDPAQLAADLAACAV